jgi:hypothetical protein
MIETVENGDQAENQNARSDDYAIGYRARPRIRALLFRWLAGQGASSDDIELIFATPISEGQVRQRLAMMPARVVDSVSKRTQVHCLWIKHQVESEESNLAQISKKYPRKSVRRTGAVDVPKRQAAFSGDEPENPRLACASPGESRIQAF